MMIYMFDPVDYKEMINEERLLVIHLPCKIKHVYGETHAHAELRLTYALRGLNPELRNVNQYTHFVLIDSTRNVSCVYMRTKEKPDEVLITHYRAHYRGNWTKSKDAVEVPEYVPS